MFSMSGDSNRTDTLTVTVLTIAHIYRHIDIHSNGDTKILRRYELGCYHAWKLCVCVSLCVLVVFICWQNDAASVCVHPCHKEKFCHEYRANIMFSHIQIAIESCEWWNEQINYWLWYSSVLSANSRIVQK